MDEEYHNLTWIDIKLMPKLTQGLLDSTPCKGKQIIW